jgi:putative colanic acid biosynthesis acetyltransferase WcaF
MIDVKANRAALKWSLRIQMARVLWGLVLPFFMFSPRPLWAWRRLLLRLFRAKIGLDVHIYPSVRITMPWNLDIGEAAAVGDRVILYALGIITIGARTTVSQGAHICAGTHDIKDSSRPLLMAPIKLGKDAWICADAFIGPNVVVGDDAIVGARAVVMKDVLSGAIVAGNPARQIKSRDQ